MKTGLAIQVGALARRSVTRTLRQPASVIPPIVFPLMLMAVNSGGLESATQLPGFPSDSFYAFALAVPFIQGALFTTMNAGTDLARDIQNGFFNRLSLTPIRAPALLAGQLAGNIVLGLAQAVIYVVAGLVIFAGLTAYDFQRLRRTKDIRTAPLLAASIFLDLVNVFLLFLSIFGGSDSRSA